MADTTDTLRAVDLPRPCSVLLDLSIHWIAQAGIHEAEGEKDCGTGSDVPYAMASMLREHAAEIERLVYVFSSQKA